MGVLTCPHCGGPRKLIALINDGLVVRKILEHLGLATEPPPMAPARAPPEPEFAWVRAPLTHSASASVGRAVRSVAQVPEKTTARPSVQATISASGFPSASAPSGFFLWTWNVEGTNDGLFFFETRSRQANSWGNGTSYQCVVPPVKSGGLLSGIGTPGACDGSFAQDLNARWCATCPRPLHNPGAGAVVQAQLWYRDPFNTSNQTTSLSDAIEFLVSP